MKKENRLESNTKLSGLYLPNLRPKGEIGCNRTSRVEVKEAGGPHKGNHSAQSRNEDRCGHQRPQ